MLASRQEPWIFPLREKLRGNLWAMQQRPKWTGGRGIPELPALPWNDEDRPPQINFGRVDLPPTAAYMLPSNYGLCALGLVSVQKKILRATPYSQVTKYPSVVHELKPIPAVAYGITGLTKDSTKAILGSCIVHQMRTDIDSCVDYTTSGADGSYRLKGGRPGLTYYVVSYKAGGTDVAGTTVNTLISTPL